MRFRLFAARPQMPARNLHPYAARVDRRAGRPAARTRLRRNGVMSWTLAGLVLASACPAFATDAEIEEVIVTASLEARLGRLGSHSEIEGEALAEIRATHVHEALVRVPGVWVARGSGQEHLTAIRSGVYTGAGACGEFLYLEDGLPIRPAGFCNINNLFEVNSEQAQRIEVWRGPSSAILGGNGLHGAVNVVTGSPRGGRVSIEGGSHGYYQARASLGGDLGGHYFGLNVHGSHSNGWRDDTGYGQQKLSLAHGVEVAGWSVRNTLTATNLNQETGGYVVGDEAYKRSELRRANPNPNAYRDAFSVRAASHWQGANWRHSAYLRRSGMQFLQHFLPGQPTETNAQVSAGILSVRSFDAGNLSGRAGAHLEWMDGKLDEVQAAPTRGSAFLMATRPTGRHYDYSIGSWMAAGFVDVGWALSPAWRLIHSLRLEHLGYNYDNHHLTGNTRDDGSACGFGGCLYTRPASRHDDFTQLAGRLGIERRLADKGAAYLLASSGFRPPQATELYRLQRGQTVADLKAERLISVELGVKSGPWSLAAFRERSRHVILRDSRGYNISDGKTRSLGVELAGGWQIGAHSFGLAATWAQHEYDFTGAVSFGELISEGNQLDSAPEWLAHGRWRYQPGERWYSEFEVNQVGKHYTNASNTARYKGHVEVNWRTGLDLGERAHLFLRIINLLNDRYAWRADYAFGNHRYFPAMPRQAYIGLDVRL